jgi:GT2 family glycosyltransferase
MSGTSSSARLPLASVVVATVNDVTLTMQCLLSLRAQTYQRLEVIVVCNGSSMQVEETLRGEFPEFVFIRTGANLGFAGGYNVGLKKARGSFVAIINNDATACRSWVEALVRTALSDDSVGAVASTVLDGHREGVQDSQGLGIALDGMSRQRDRGVSHRRHLEAMPVLLPSGCACLFSQKALADVGLFDEHFFAYCEDADLGLRLRWRGYTVLLAPGAEVVHHYSMTTGPFSLRKIFWVERNHLWLVVKDFPLPLLFVVPVATLWRFAIQARAMWSKNGELNRFAEGGSKARIVLTVLSAWASCLAGLPEMIRKRHDIRRHACISSWAMCRTIWSWRLSMREVLLGDADAGQ